MSAARQPVQRPTLLLLHGSMGHGGMWKALRERLQGCFRTVAPDLIGYGCGAPWSPGQGLRLEDEVELLGEEVDRAGGPIHLAGYSYGGAVALALASARAARVASLTLIEPVAFPALALAGDHAAYGEFRRWHQRFERSVGQGRARQAMQRFVDAWSGGPVWESLDPGRRRGLELMAEKVAWDWRASFGARLSRDALALLGPCTTLVRGEASPPPMLSLVAALHRLMACSTLAVIPGANHLLPLTHAQALAEVLCATRARARCDDCSRAGAPCSP